MVTVACLGDSNTLGYPRRGLFDLEGNHPFSELLSQMLDIICRQYARCGASYMGLPNDRRLPSFTFCKSFEEFKRDPRPDAVVLCLGTNDSTIFKPKDAESVAILSQKVEELATQLNGFPLLVISPLGIRHKDAFRKSMRDIIFAEFRKHHHRNRVFLDTEDLDPKFYQQDKKHLTVEGQGELARRIARPLCELLQSELGTERLPRRMIKYLSTAPATEDDVPSAPHPVSSAQHNADDSSLVQRTIRVPDDSDAASRERRPSSPAAQRPQRLDTEHMGALSHRGAVSSLAPTPRANATLGRASLSTTTMSDAGAHPPLASRYGMSTRGQFRRHGTVAGNAGFGTPISARRRMPFGARPSAREAPRQDVRQVFTKAADDEDGAISELGRESTVSSWIKGDQTSSASRDGTDDNLSHGNDAASYVSRLSTNTSFLAESKDLMDSESWELSMHRSKQPRKKWQPDRDFAFPSQKDPFQKVYEMLQSLNPNDRDTVLNHPEFPPQVRNALKDDPLVAMWQRGDRWRIKPGDVISTLHYETRYQMPQEVEYGSELKLGQTISITAEFCETNDSKKGADGAVFGLRRINDPYGPYALAFYRTGEVYVNGYSERPLMPRWKSEDRISIKYANLKNGVARFVISLNQKPGRSSYGIKKAAFVPFVAMATPCADRIELSNSNAEPHEQWRYRGRNPDTTEILYVASCCRFATPEMTVMSDEGSPPAADEVPAEGQAAAAKEARVLNKPCVVPVAGGDGVKCENAAPRSPMVPAPREDDRSESCVFFTPPQQTQTVSPMAGKDGYTACQDLSVMEKGNTVSLAPPAEDATSPSTFIDNPVARYHEDPLKASLSTIPLSVSSTTLPSETTVSARSIAPYHDGPLNASSSTEPSLFPTVASHSEPTVSGKSMASHHTSVLNTTLSTVPLSVPTAVHDSETTASVTNIALRDGSLPSVSSPTIPLLFPSSVYHSETTPSVASFPLRHDEPQNVSSSRATLPFSVPNAEQHSETTASVTSIHSHCNGSLNATSSTAPLSAPTAAKRSATMASAASGPLTVGISAAASSTDSAIWSGAAAVVQASDSHVIVDGLKKPNVRAQKVNAVSETSKKRAPRRARAKASSSGVSEPAAGMIISVEADAASGARQNHQVDMSSIKSHRTEGTCKAKPAPLEPKPARRKREGAKTREKREKVVVKALPVGHEQAVTGAQSLLRARPSDEVSGNETENVRTAKAPPIPHEQAISGSRSVFLARTNDEAFGKEDVENRRGAKAPPARLIPAPCRIPEPAPHRIDTEDRENKETERERATALPVRSVPEAFEPALQTKASAETSESSVVVKSNSGAPGKKDVHNIILGKAHATGWKISSAEASSEDAATGGVAKPLLAQHNGAACSASDPAWHLRMSGKDPANEEVENIVVGKPPPPCWTRTCAENPVNKEVENVEAATSALVLPTRTSAENPVSKEAENGVLVKASPTFRTRAAEEVSNNATSSDVALSQGMPERRKRVRAQASKNGETESAILGVTKASQGRPKRIIAEALKKQDANGGVEDNISLVQQKPEGTDTPEDEVLTSSSLRRRPAAVAIISADDIQPKRQCIAQSSAAENKMDAAQEPEQTSLYDAIAMREQV